MSQFSRVRKNQDLYQDIIQDDSSEIIESSLRDYERRVSKDSIESSAYVASRLKRNEQIVEHIEEEVVEVVEEPIQLQSAAKEDILSDRDLLSDFIEEVKHYNINKGLRSVQDTQTNILNNLSQGGTQDRVESEPQSILELTSEIQQIIGDLDTMEIHDELDDNDNDVPVLKTLDHEEDEELASIFNEIETSSLSLEEILNADHIEVSNKEVYEPKAVEKVTEEIVIEPVVIESTDKKHEEKTDFKANELLELTQTLSLKLDLQEKELEDVQAHSTIVDKILTGVIVILIIAMILLVSYGIWWVYTERGF